MIGASKAGLTRYACRKAEASDERPRADDSRQGILQLHFQFKKVRRLDQLFLQPDDRITDVDQIYYRK